MALMDASSRIDRASHLRKDTERLLAALDATDTLLVPVWRGQNFILQAPSPSAVIVPNADAPGLVALADEIVWLGLWQDRHCFALDVSSLDAPVSEPTLAQAELGDLRLLGGLLPFEHAEVLAYARGILRWHRHHRFCGTCGAETKPREGGHVRECSSDGEKHFPRTDPAVMVLVEHSGRCVLARQPGWPAGMYSVIAGFVEPGESVEDAAVRETLEELGLSIDRPRYFRSQPWPFPSSLMLGYRSTAQSDVLTIDRIELEDARWFSREELQEPKGFFYPPPFSLAHHLIRAFLEEG